jgi:hypothetical protein
VKFERTVPSFSVNHGQEFHRFEKHQKPLKRTNTFSKQSYQK